MCVPSGEWRFIYKFVDGFRFCILVAMSSSECFAEKKVIVVWQSEMKWLKEEELTVMSWSETNQVEAWKKVN